MASIPLVTALTAAALLALLVPLQQQVAVEARPSQPNGCPSTCSCPERVAPLRRCPGGAAPVRDECGCCDACPPRRHGEPCGPGAAACDLHAGLVCRPLARRGRGGVCVRRRDLADAVALLPRPALPPGSCEFDGVLYLDGENFHVGCLMRCSCKASAIGCVPFCAKTAIEPSPDCPEPRLAPPPPGECCERWVCGQPEAADNGNKTGDELGGQAAVAGLRDPAKAPTSTHPPPPSGSCRFEGVLRLDGQRFRVGCKKSCTCSAGGIRCVPVCPKSAMLPSPGCPEPRLAPPPPGECCERWVCGQPEADDGDRAGDEREGRAAAAGKGRGRRDPAAAAALEALPRRHRPPGSCVFRGALHLDGERFRVGCLMRCSCNAGAIGCVPFCPQSAMLPSPSCPEPRLAPPPPGECCERWECGQPEAAAGSGKPTGDVLGGDTAMAAFRQEDTMMVVAPPGGSSSGSESPPPPPGGPAGPVVRSAAAPPFACEMVYSSEWSACSRSCGAGISTRISTENPRCRMERQVRACVVRPCDLPVPPPRKPGKRCARTFRAPSPVRLRDPAGPSGAACVSLRRYRPRYCGACSDGRCCTPHRTLTRSVRMRCAGGRVTLRDVMVVRTCACHRHCPDDDEGNDDNEV